MLWRRLLAAAPNLARHRCWSLQSLTRQFSNIALCSASLCPARALIRAPKTLLTTAAVLAGRRSISTLKRRVFKIKKHKKKKRKKRLSRFSIIPWRPPSEERKAAYQLPYKMRRIVKERRRRNKGNRTLRVPRQR